mgnify:FL=1
MASTSASAGDGHAAFLTKADEMSLAESVAAQTADSVPDTLEVRSDALSVMQDSTDSMRGPARKAAMAAGIALLVIVGGAILSRAMRGRTESPTQ